jgi:hypothetical protein
MLDIDHATWKIIPHPEHRNAVFTADVMMLAQG